jgi:hypothetical protein
MAAQAKLPRVSAALRRCRVVCTFWAGRFCLFCLTQLTTDIIITAEDHVEEPLVPLVKPLDVHASEGVPEAVARCIAILERPVSFDPREQMESRLDDMVEEQEQREKEVDTGIVVFPPGSLPGGSREVAVTALITGEGSMSSPRGKCK